MAGSITPQEIDTALRDVSEALAKTSDSSVLPADEQDLLLAQACAEACEVLGGWLRSSSWQELSPAGESGRRAVKDSITDWERLRPYLPSVTEAVTRASRREPGAPGMPGVEDPATYVDRLISAAKLTARRQWKLDRGQLYAIANDRLDALRTQACEIASDFKSETEKRATEAERKADRKRVRSLLVTVVGVLFTLSLTMAGASPTAVAQNIPSWGHDIHAVQMLFVHQLAYTAAPTVTIAPPQLGPRLSH